MHCRPLSRLTYCAYLIHPLVIWVNYRNIEVQTRIIRHKLQTVVCTIYLVQIALHGSVLTMAWMYVGNLGLSYAAALLLSLVFEAPFLNLQKIFGI